MPADRLNGAQHHRNPVRPGPWRPRGRGHALLRVSARGADEARVGGLLDPNYEAIVALKPDLVILLEEHVQALPGFQKLKLDTLVVSHQTIDGVIESFRTIGKFCGKGPEGRRMAEEHENRLRHILAKTQSLPRPRVDVAGSDVRPRSSGRRLCGRRRPLLRPHD